MDNDALRERVWKANEAFKRLLPTLNAYAQALTGKPVSIKVSASPGSSTNGMQIFMCPPLVLADDYSHNFALCDSRDPETLIQRCPACAQREHVLIHIYHEISHIYNESFKKQNFNAGERRAFFEKTLGHPIRRLSGIDNPFEIAKVMEPEYGVFMLNVCEDLRVNKAMYEARGGTRKMMRALMVDTMVNGYEDQEGKRHVWSDAPEDMQAIITLDNMGEAVDSLLSERVEALRDDEELQQLVAECTNPRASVTTNLVTSAKMFRRLRELGFFQPDEDDEGESDDESDDQEESEGDDEGDSGSDDDDDDSESNDDGESSEGESQESEGQPQPRKPTPDELEHMMKQARPHENITESQVPDPERDQNPWTANEEREIVQDVIDAAEYFSTFSSEISGCKVFRYGEGKWRDPIPRPDLNASSVTKSVQVGRLIFEDNVRARNERNLKSGKISSRTLGKRAPLSDPRMFRKRHIPGKKDYHVLLGMDVSGSTYYTLPLEVRAVFAQAEVLHRLGVSFEIVGHTGLAEYDKSGNWNYKIDLAMFIVKEPGEPWNIRTQEKLFSVASQSANLDGHSLEFMRKRVMQTRAEEHVIMYYSDGAMPMENYEEELMILQREIALCRKQGVALMGVGIGTDSPSKHGLPTVQVDSDDDLPKVVSHIESALTRR